MKKILSMKDLGLVLVAGMQGCDSVTSMESFRAYSMVTKL